MMCVHFGSQAAVKNPPRDVIHFLPCLRSIHSQIYSVINLTDKTFRTSILLSTIYCTFDMIFGIFYTLTIISEMDKSSYAQIFKLLMFLLINISYVLALLILFIWFSWQCEEAIVKVYNT